MAGRILIAILLLGTTGMAQEAQQREIEEELNRRLFINTIVNDDGWQGLLRTPTAIYYDPTGDEVFVADAGNNRVLVYHPDLTPKFTFQHFIRDERTGEMVPGEPKDMVVNSLGEIILLDNRVDYIEVLDFRGKPLERIRPAALLGDTTLEVRAQGLAIDANDNLYAALTGDVTTVLKLNQQFELIDQIGRKGNGPDQFNTPMAITVWRDIVVVTDLYGRPAVKVFDTSGVYQYGFAAHDIDKADLSFPSGVTVVDNIAGGYTIWVADGLRQVLKVYDNTGEFLALVGGYGFGPGEFRYPNDIVAAGDSAYYVLERIGNRIQHCQIK